MGRHRQQSPFSQVLIGRLQEADPTTTASAALRRHFPTTPEDQNAICASTSVLQSVRICVYLKSSIVLCLSRVSPAPE